MEQFFSESEDHGFCIDENEPARVQIMEMYKAYKEFVEEKWSDPERASKREKGHEAAEADIVLLSQCLSPNRFPICKDSHTEHAILAFGQPNVQLDNRWWKEGRCKSIPRNDFEDPARHASVRRTCRHFAIGPRTFSPSEVTSSFHTAETLARVSSVIHDNPCVYPILGLSPSDVQTARSELETLHKISPFPFKPNNGAQSIHNYGNHQHPVASEIENGTNTWRIGTTVCDILFRFKYEQEHRSGTARHRSGQEKPISASFGHLEVEFGTVTGLRDVSKKYFRDEDEDEGGNAYVPVPGIRVGDSCRHTHPILQRDQSFLSGIGVDPFHSTSSASTRRSETGKSGTGNSTTLLLSGERTAKDRSTSSAAPSPPLAESAPRCRGRRAILEGE